LTGAIQDVSVTIYLVGVDHIIQHDGFLWPAKLAAIEEFSRYLEKEVATREVSLIAEEFSLDALAKSCATTSTATAVADRHGAKHLFCDPGRNERKEHQITNGDQREEFWLQRLSGYLGENILLLCGESHLETLKERIHGKGTPAEILSRGWGAGLNPEKTQPSRQPDAR
jgi:hypothetical protein